MYTGGESCRKRPWGRRAALDSWFSHLCPAAWLGAIRGGLGSREERMRCLTVAIKDRDGFDLEQVLGVGEARDLDEVLTG